MTVLRANVEATKQFIRVRLGNPYVYGGALSTNIKQGTDCSEVWQTVLEMVHGRWVPGRQSEGATTESYRGMAIGGRGPFGTIRVGHWRDIPSNAVARLAFHHGPGGGANSHMWGDLDGMRIESGGSKGLVSDNRALAVEDGYAHFWVYLPGPIVDDGTPIPEEVVLLGRNYENRGERVRQLQEALNTKGGFWLEVDGDFGPLTEAAVTAYQRSKGFEIDGIAGPKVLESLGLKFSSTPISLPRKPSGGLTAEVLAKIMDHRVSMQRYVELLPRVELALALANCNTIERRAMWFAQVGHESGGLKYQEEIASGAAYEGRADLGNTQPGDGKRYKGRDFIQITGRHNYTKLSQWAHRTGLTSSPTFFVDNPQALATDLHAFTGVTWYWTVARNMNSFADKNDLLGATRAVNGGTHGLDDRREFYARALAMGNALLDSENPWEELIMSTTPISSKSHYRIDNKANATPLDMLRGIDAMKHEEMIESAAFRGEIWAIQVIAKLASGTLPGAQDPDGKFWVARAIKILNLIDSTHPDWIKSALSNVALEELQ